MDRIIVKKTEDILNIVEWSKGFLTTLAPDEPVEFQPPFKKGEVFFEDEQTRLHFEYIGDGAVRMKVYTTTVKHHGLFVKYIFNYSTASVSDIRYGEWVDSAMAESYLRAHGDIHATYGVYWFCLMLLATYYRPEFERKQYTSGEKKASKVVPKKTGKKKKNSPKTLYVKNYVVDAEIFKSIPRHHRKPDHEYGVRGHYRHYKSGKVVWIEPHKRCCGRGKEKDRNYIAKVED